MGIVGTPLMFVLVLLLSLIALVGLGNVIRGGLNMSMGWNKD
jgi:hypothetical protein